MFQTKDTDACVATRILFIVVKFLVAKLETPHSLQSIKRGLVLFTVLRNIFLQIKTHNHFCLVLRLLEVSFQWDRTDLPSSEPEVPSLACTRH